MPLPRTPDADATGMIVDLSHPITDRMPVYPGDPGVSIRSALDLDRDGVAVSEVHLGSHTGTHIDAPAHTVQGGRTMADVALDELVGEALVLRVRGLADGEVYDWARLNDDAPVPERVPPIVVIDTGWERWFGSERAGTHPSLHPEVARELVARGMRVLGVDTLSPDPTHDGVAAFPAHDAVLGSDGLIVENLRGLESLPTTARIGFFPLRLGGDGAPVRAVAFL